MTAPLRDAVAALGRPFGRERSCRLAPGRLLQDRELFTLALDDELRAAVPALCSVRGLAPADAETLCAGLADAAFVHLGREATADGEVFKVYCETARGAADDLAPSLRHLALKWRVGDDRAVESRYTRIPAASRGAVVARIASICVSDPTHPAPELTRHLLEAAARTPAAGLPELLEVTEAGTPRISFDLNVYDARLTLAELRAPIVEAARRLDVEVECLDWLRGAERDALGHVAGGVHRAGEPFVTMYHGVEAGS